MRAKHEARSIDVYKSNGVQLRAGLLAVRLKATGCRHATNSIWSEWRGVAWRSMAVSRLPIWI